VVQDVKTKLITPIIANIARIEDLPYYGNSDSHINGTICFQSVFYKGANNGTFKAGFALNPKEFRSQETVVRISFKF
jgi:hypothetical protein